MQKDILIVLFQIITHIIISYMFLENTLLTLFLSTSGQNISFFCHSGPLVLNQECLPYKILLHIIFSFLFIPVHEMVFIVPSLTLLNASFHCMSVCRSNCWSLRSSVCLPFWQRSSIFLCVCMPLKCVSGMSRIFSHIFLFCHFFLRTWWRF